MATGTQSRGTSGTDVEQQDRPEISVCEGAPGKAIFLESGNTDGWIASDTTYEVTR